MGLTSKLLSSLIGGVSQQPAVLRLENQCELMENALPTIVHGLEKRPGSEFLTQVVSNADGTVYGHLINRDTNERYIVLFTGDADEPIEVYNIDGVKATVQYGIAAPTAALYTSAYSDSDTCEIGYKATRGGGPL